MHDRRSWQRDTVEDGFWEGPIGSEGRRSGGSGEDRFRTEEDLWAQGPVLSRAEHRRRLREQAHARPARMRLRTAAVAAVVVVLLAWLVVSRLISGPTAPSTAPETTDLAPSSEDVSRGREVPPDAGEDHGTGEGDEGSGAEHPSDGPGDADSEGATVLIVHVAGAVRQPGIVELDPGARVHEAVEAAGGPQDDAALEGLNLAAPVQDGGLIHVPTVEELESGRMPPGADQGTSSGADGAGPPGVGSAAGDDGGAALVDVNTADAEQLQTLPGIGPAMAERIISHREAEGAFSALEDLAAVSGIGPARLQELDGRVTW